MRAPSKAATRSHQLTALVQDIHGCICGICGSGPGGGRRAGTPSWPGSISSTVVLRTLLRLQGKLLCKIVHSLARWLVQIEETVLRAA